MFIYEPIKNVSTPNLSLGPCDIDQESDSLLFFLFVRPACDWSPKLWYLLPQTPPTAAFCDADSPQWQVEEAQMTWQKNNNSSSNNFDAANQRAVWISWASLGEC